MVKIKDYRDLVVWQRAHKLVLAIYRVTRQFPAEEKYGLVQQIRRSAASIPTNIAEGTERYSRKEYLQFLYISRGSLSETDYHVLLSYDLEYISSETYNILSTMIIEIGKMLNGLINALKPSC